MNDRDVTVRRGNLLWAVLFWLLGVALWTTPTPAEQGWWVILGSVAMLAGTLMAGRAIVDRWDR